MVMPACGSHELRHKAENHGQRRAALLGQLLGEQKRPIVFGSLVTAHPVDDGAALLLGFDQSPDSFGIYRHGSRLRFADSRSNPAKEFIFNQEPIHRQGIKIFSVIFLAIFFDIFGNISAVAYFLQWFDLNRRCINFKDPLFKRRGKELRFAATYF
jgi:hypothetical protein